MKRLALGDPSNKIRTPIRLTDGDMAATFGKTIAGENFYLIGGIACPTCGALQAIKLEQLPDDTIAWFLIFSCKHYNLPVVEDVPIDPTLLNTSETPVV